MRHIRETQILAAIFCFNVKLDPNFDQLAKKKNVRMYNFNVIYDLLHQVEEEMLRLLPPSYDYNVLGTATVAELFEISLGKKKTMMVAGCAVNSGVISLTKENKVVRVKRNDKYVLTDGMLRANRESTVI